MALPRFFAAVVALALLVGTPVTADEMVGAVERSGQITRAALLADAQTCFLKRPTLADSARLLSGPAQAK